MGNQVRFVTHADVSADDIDTVLDRAGPVDTGVAHCAGCSTSPTD
jgi:hypothetical protein